MFLAAFGIWRALGVAGSRWIHLLAGITWIGLLYYFNFVQTPSFAQFEAGPRTEAIRKLVPRALLWFRMAAALTFLTGLLILGFQGQFSGTYFKLWPGMTIFAGMLTATVMMLNVWLVIWPAQKVVIANAEGVAAGKEADPNAASAGRKGALASRTNTLFSIPVMWFMIGTTHFTGITSRFFGAPSANRRLVWYVAVIVLTAVFEANALGVFGGYSVSPIRKYLDDHRSTIFVGFVLWAIYFVLMIGLSSH